MENHCKGRGHSKDKLHTFPRAQLFPLCPCLLRFSLLWGHYLLLQIPQHWRATGLGLQAASQLQLTLQGSHALLLALNLIH